MGTHMIYDCIIEVTRSGKFRTPIELSNVYNLRTNRIHIELSKIFF